jgi:hypothetical protein
MAEAQAAMLKKQADEARYAYELNMIIQMLPARLKELDQQGLLMLAGPSQNLELSAENRMELASQAEADRLERMQRAQELSAALARRNVSGGAGQRLRNAGADAEQKAAFGALVASLNAIYENRDAGWEIPATRRALYARAITDQVPSFSANDVLLMAAIPDSPAVGERQRYISTMPAFGEVVSSRQPCMFEQQIREGPGFLKYACDRADPATNSKRCVLTRVTQKRSELVPVNCSQDVLAVTKGFDVQRRVITMPNGQRVTQQIVTPDVAVFGNVRREGPPLPGVPLQITDAQRAQMGFIDGQRQSMQPYGGLLWNGRNDRNFGGRGAGRQAQKVAVAGARRTGGAPGPMPSYRGAPVDTCLVAGAQNAGAQNAGAIMLPSRRKAREGIKFDREDVENFELGAMPGVIKQPASWAGLPQFGPNEIGFYTYSGYGTTDNKHRSYGYAFEFRHLPYEYMSQISYMEWLITLSYRLRHEWSQYHRHVFDPIRDTIATMETYVLVTLGRLETANVYFIRREMFAGAEPFARVMQDTLQKYVFSPPVRIWKSPIGERYLDNAVGVEADAIDDVELLAYATVALMKSKLNTSVTIVLDRDDAQIMGVMEDTMLALLCRMQYLHRHTLNTWSDEVIPVGGSGLTVTGRDFGVVPRAIADRLLSIGQVGERKFLTKQFARYLELYRLDDENTALHYLEGLAIEQAKAMGLQLPNLQAATAALTARVGSMTMFGTPTVAVPAVMPDQFQTIIQSPRINDNIIVPGYGIVAPAAAGGNGRIQGQPQQTPQQQQQPPARR